MQHFVPDCGYQVLILIGLSSRTPRVNEMCYGSDDVLAVLPLQVSETAPRVGLAVDPEETQEGLCWLNMPLVAERDRDNETACPVRIGSCLPALVRQERAQQEMDSLVRSVVPLVHILLGRPIHQIPFEREGGRGKHLRGRVSS
jgi:hypothetical protein